MNNQKLEDFKNLQKYKIESNVQILEQYLLQKSNILEKLKHTELFPYLINMEYLVGNIDSVTVTDDPIEEIGPYLNIQDGINQKLNVSFTREELLDWELFRLVTIHCSEKEGINHTIKSYVLLRILNGSLMVLIFGILDNRIIPEKEILKLLNSDVKIIETKQQIEGF
jgi:hypothetical protein